MDTRKFLKLKAYAKINLGLDVTGKRENGYHDLRMIMQTVRLHDRVFMRPTRAKGIRVKTNLGFLPSGESNIAGKAARLLMDEFGIEDGIFIEIDKHIPVAAGLAGGSTDAAAVMVGMNRLFDLGLTKEELMERAVKIGADVPYCILRGTALAEGIGEELTVLEPMKQCKVVLAKPPIHVSTKFVYGNLHVDEIKEHPQIDAQIEAIRRGDLAEVAHLMGNVLQDVTIPAYPVIDQIKKVMMDEGAVGAMMSGSGPTVFGLFDDDMKAETAFKKLKNGKLAKQVYLTDLFNNGVNKVD